MKSEVTLISLCVVHTLAVISPGPDFLVVTRIALAGGASRGIWCTAGKILANALQLIGAVLMTSLLMEQSPWVMTVVKICGALYLGYIGIKCLNSKPANIDPTINIPLIQLSRRSVFIEGFVSGTLNGKAIVYFTSIASQFDPRPEMFIHNLGMVAVLLTITTTWFSSISCIVGHQAFRSRLMSRKHILDRTMGTALITYAGFIFYGAI